MRFEFKAVRKAIHLAEYAGEMDGAVILVQVNVTREVKLRMMSVSAETPDDEFFELLRELWEPEEWPVEDVRALRDHCAQNDPELWKWITGRTWELVMEYQGLKKKE